MSARRRGPALTVEFSQRDRERTDPRQLRQLRWRSARAAGILCFSCYKVDPACRASFEINFMDIVCVNLNLRRFGLVVNSYLELTNLVFFFFDIFVK